MAKLQFRLKGPTWTWSKLRKQWVYFQTMCPYNLKKYCILFPRHMNIHFLKCISNVTILLTMCSWHTHGFHVLSKIIHSRKRIWKCHLRNGDHLSRPRYVNEHATDYGLAQVKRNLSVLAMALRLSCTNPLIFYQYQAFAVPKRWRYVLQDCPAQENWLTWSHLAACCAPFTNMV